MKKRKLTKKELIIYSITLFVLTTLFIAILFVDFSSYKNSSNNTNPILKQNKIKATETFPTPPKSIPKIATGDISVETLTNNNYFYKNKNGEFNCTYIKGVNIGLTLPTTDLKSPDIDYNTYKSWFYQISSMNANTIRVFTIMNPDFYKALYDYNTTASKPLYLIQGVWFNESYMEEVGDAFGNNGIIVNSFKKGVKEAVDIIHGRSSTTTYGSIKNAVYDKDVSKYLIGYVLGLEWQSKFVENTNNKYKKAQFVGDYLETKNASAFEIFLAEIGESLVSYETQAYKFQSPIAFLNWQTTDIIKHTNEPFKEEDQVSVNTQNILSTSKYFAKMFAAVDIYPYYPEFMNLQPEYINFIDNNGKKNPYRAYLKDLKKEYNVPLIVAETGLSTSRGKAHTSIMGYNQGRLTEKQQGEYLGEMLTQIAREGYAGSLIFNWQDEWFKQTWNTTKFYPTDTNKRTPNVQSSEQGYGLLAFDPGETENACYPDGEISEWQKTAPLFSSNETDVYIKTDEAYFYILANKQSGNFDNNKYIIPISTTTRGSTNSKNLGVYFNMPVDFIVEINGKKQTRVLVDAYYDSFYYNYSIIKNVFPKNSSYSKRNSGQFNKINQFLSNEIIVPMTKKVIAPTYYEAGLLTFGNANPNSEDYNSLANFYYNENFIEIRIPWSLLNVYNSNEKAMLDNLYDSKTPKFVKGENIFVGFSDIKNQTKRIQLYEFVWEEKQKSTFHQRLKQSYYNILQTYKELMKEYQ